MASRTRLLVGGDDDGDDEGVMIIGTSEVGECSL